MHDIDSTRLETSHDQQEYPDHQEFERETGQHGEESFEMPISQEEEEALAAELLGVSSEAELDQFFGKLFRKLRPAIGGAAKFLARNAGPLSGALKGIARKGLPFLGGALGTMIPIPGVGTALGSALGGAAAKLLEFEMENMEFEEREFELAKRFVRFATQAVRQGVRLPPRFNPMAAANLALRHSIHRLRSAPGFRARPIYRVCPPCPVCVQPLSAADTATDDGNGLSDTRAVEGASQPAQSAGAPSGAASGEFEFEHNGEFEFEHDGEFEDSSEFEDAGEFEDANQGEFEYYETQNEAFAHRSPHRARSGRWVRRGRKIVLYGV